VFYPLFPQVPFDSVLAMDVTDPASIHDAAAELDEPIEVGKLRDSPGE